MNTKSQRYLSLISFYFILILILNYTQFPIILGQEIYLELPPLSPVKEGQKPK